MAEPTHPYEVLDVFTESPLLGNPVAVFTSGEDIPSRLMQPTARELNLSETVFLLPGDAECDAHARIFTPATELPFAGHPVLGAAFVVGERDDLEVVRLRTGSGVVPVRLQRDEDGEILTGAMDQPIPTVSSFADVAQMLAALGVDSAALPVEVYDNGPCQVMVMLDDVSEVTALAPDLRALGKLGAYNFSCFALTDQGARTRMFAPGNGVNEDPATGSAAGPLALHLVRHGRLGFGAELEIVQGVELERRSVLHARIEGSPDAIQRVIVSGRAVVVARGHFRLG